jgi:hypothetical protein
LDVSCKSGHVQKKKLQKHVRGIQTGERSKFLKEKKETTKTSNKKDDNFEKK